MDKMRKYFDFNAKLEKQVVDLSLDPFYLFIVKKFAFVIIVLNILNVQACAYNIFSEGVKHTTYSLYSVVCVLLWTLKVNGDPFVGFESDH